MRNLSFLAALAAIAAAGCDNTPPKPPPPSAESLLAFVFFHADPAQPASPTNPLPQGLKIERTSLCHYQLNWHRFKDSEYQADMAFSPTATLRIEPDPPGYWQHMDGATVSVLTKMQLPARRIFSQEYGQTYDAIIANRFNDDGLAQRAVAALQTFRENYLRICP